MSHANGEVWSHHGQLLAHFEFDGTSGVACSRLYLDEPELRKNWRGDNRRACVCSGPVDDVLLYTDYGPGYYWPGKVCWRCMAIVRGIFLDEEVCTRGRPFPKRLVDEG